ncbi:MAG: SDR family oxidoreductase [Clostridiales bacterium]|jgi:2-deoxy-D-gluconate 3-dehydrogenase|nr:SDR family oxidoreductase [Clostridiales bacterium]
MELEELFSLKGKNAIVTGGARGIGAGISKGLSIAGANVLAIGSSENTAFRAKQLAAQGYSITGMQADISDTKILPDIFNEAAGMLGNVDILVNNAAVQFRCPADEFPLEELNRLINLNFTSSFLLCQMAAKHMKPKGYGKIINLASMNSFFGAYNVSVYSASKGAVAQMTKAMSNEWASFGINVNAIAPGGFKTDMTKAVWSDDESSDFIVKRTPAGRWGDAGDIMGAAIYLASHASDYVCGVILPVDGGYLVR